MKNTIKTFILLLLTLSFNSCDNAEDLLDVKFNSQLSADLNVDIPAVEGKSLKVTGISFSEQTTINPRSDSQIDKYFDLLKSFDVIEVKGTIKNVSAPVKITSGVISISDGSNTASWSISDFDVVQGASVTLDNSTGQWDIINNILDNKRIFTAKIEGTVDRSDVSFVLTVFIKAKVVANPLN